MLVHCYHEPSEFLFNVFQTILSISLLYSARTENEYQD